VRRMIELINNVLNISFPEVHEKAECKISFERLVSVDHHISLLDGKNCPALISNGVFPLSAISNFSETVPKAWLKKSGAALLISKTEELSIQINCSYPMAIKIGKGNVSLISGKQWCIKLLGSSGDCLVFRGLNNFNLRDGKINRFIDTSLETDHSDEGKFGEMQIVVYPMKADVYGEIESMKLASGSKSMPGIDDEYFWIDAWDANYVEMSSVYLMEAT